MAHRPTALLAAILMAGIATALPAQTAAFRRGDANDDGDVGIDDAIALLGNLFGNAPSPPCDDAADANDDGALDVSDPITILLHLYSGASPLPPPFPDCGFDPTPDDVPCDRSAPCDLPPHEVLSAWLADHPLVRIYLIWWEPGRGWNGYGSWSQDLKDELGLAFDAAWDGTAGAIASVPPNLLEPGDLGSTRTILSAADAKALYLSLVVQSLLVEIKGLVPWSIEDYAGPELEILFDGRKLVRTSPLCIPDLSTLLPTQTIPASCTDVGLELQSAWGLPAPGPEAFEFLESEVGIGESSLETAANLVEWARRNMLHFAGSLRADVCEYYWGYRGAVPASRIIEGSDPTGFHPQSQEWGLPPGTGYDALFAHWTAGCHGTVTFFREVLRAVNLPVLYEVAGGHALPHFLADEVWLSHGDDPYNVMAKADYPASLLLIDAATHDAWFGDAAAAAANVGRQVKVLAAIHLPDALLRYRCDDLASGLPPEGGSVYGYLQPAYTLEDLETMGFWEEIDRTTDERGGCAAVR